MGSRLFSNTTNLLGGHDFTNAQHRAKVADALKIPVDRIPDKPSLAYDQIIQGIEDGKIKGLWMIATNAAHSWINQQRFKDAVAKLDFFVVQDMYATTETARLAHLVLPTGGWGEKTRHLHQQRAAHWSVAKSFPCAGSGTGGLSYLPAHRRVLGLRRDVP